MSVLALENISDIPLIGRFAFEFELIGVSATAGSLCGGKRFPLRGNDGGAAAVPPLRGGFCHPALARPKINRSAVSTLRDALRSRGGEHTNSRNRNQKTPLPERIGKGAICFGKQGFGVYLYCIFV